MDKFFPIPDFDGYFINKLGVILSKRQKKDRILKPKMEKIGYYRICLMKDKKKKTMTLHRLIAVTFIPNPDNLPFVDHHDRIRTNNSLVNLSWASRELNAHNQTRHKDNKLGHKHITLHVDKRRNNDEWYRFIINRYGKIHNKCFKTLEEAIKYRDEYLTELGEEIID
tara:strand:+ start:722 stop:1225 length:504 start_codon:yes stop_codon:yes gene_type:complete